MILTDLEVKSSRCHDKGITRVMIQTTGQVLHRRIFEISDMDAMDTGEGRRVKDESEDFFTDIDAYYAGVDL